MFYAPHEVKGNNLRIFEPIDLVVVGDKERG